MIGVFSFRSVVSAVAIGFLLLGGVVAEESVGGKVERYYEALLRRPMNAQLFERFYAAWYEERESGALAEFMVKGAEQGWQGRALLARYQQRSGQEAAALQSLELVLQEVPESHALRMMRAELLMRELAYVQAVDELERVVAGEAEEELLLKAVGLLGTCYLREGKAELAVELWSMWVSRSDAGLEFVEAAASEGMYEQAVVLAEQLVASTREPYAALRYRVRLGELQSLAGQPTAALETLSAALSEVGLGSWLEAEILQSCDVILSRRGDLELELAFYGELEQQYGQRPAVVKRYAYQLARNERWEEAQERFQSLLRASPRAKGLRQEYVRLLISGERLEEALAELTTLSEQVGYDEELARQKITLLRRLQRSEELREEIENVQRNAGDTPAAHIKSAQLYLRHGFHTEGEQLLLEATAQDASYGAHVLLANHYLKEEREGEAAELLQTVAKEGALQSALQAVQKLTLMGRAEEGYAILLGRQAEYGLQGSYLTEMCQLGVRSGRAAEVVPMALDLVNRAQTYAEIKAALLTAGAVITRAGAQEAIITQLEGSDTPAQRALLAELYMRQEAWDKVEAVLQPGVQAQSITETYLWVDLLQRQRKYQQACTVLEGLADTPEGKRTVYLSKLTALQVRTHAYAQALESIERWKAVAPQDKQPWIQENVVHNKMQAPRKGVQSLRRALARFEDAEDLRQMLGAQYMRAHLPAQAYEVYWRSYTQALTDAEQYAWAQRLVRFAAEEEMLADLRRRLEQRREENPRSVMGVRALSLLHQERGDLEQERVYIEQALEMQPEHAQWWLRLATVHEAIGDLDLATLAYAEGMEYDSDGRIAAREIQFFLRTAQPQQALARLEHVMDGMNARSSEQLALQFYQLDYWDEAIQVLQQALTTAPQDALLHYLLGSIYEDCEQYEKALSHFQLVYGYAASAVLGTPASAGSAGAPHVVASSTPRPITFSDIAQAQEPAYRRNFQVRYSGGRSSNSAIHLPTSQRELRIYTHIHLARLTGRVGPAERQSLIQTLEAQGIEHAQALPDYLRYIQLHSRHDMGANGTSELLSLIQKYPQVEPIYELLSTSPINAHPTALDIHLLALRQHAEHLRYQAATTLLRHSKQPDHRSAALHYLQGQLKQAVDDLRDLTPPPLATEQSVAGIIRTLILTAQTYTQVQRGLPPAERDRLQTGLTQAVDCLMEHDTTDRCMMISMRVLVQLEDEPRLRKLLGRISDNVQASLGEQEEPAPSSAPFIRVDPDFTMIQRASVLVSSINEYALSPSDALDYYMRYSPEYSSTFNALEPLDYLKPKYMKMSVSSPGLHQMRVTLAESTDDAIIKAKLLEMEEDREPFFSFIAQQTRTESAMQHYFRIQYLLMMLDKSRATEALASHKMFAAWGKQNAEIQDFVNVLTCHAMITLAPEQREPYLPLAEPALRSLHARLKAHAEQRIHTRASSSTHSYGMTGSRVENALIQIGKKLGVEIAPDIQQMVKSSPSSPPSGGQHTNSPNPKAQKAASLIRKAHETPIHARVKTYLDKGDKAAAYALAIRLLKRGWNENKHRQQRPRKSRLLQYFNKLNITTELVPLLTAAPAQHEDEADEIAAIILSCRGVAPAQSYIMDSPAFTAYGRDLRVRLLADGGSLPEGYAPYTLRSRAELHSTVPRIVTHDRRRYSLPFFQLVLQDIQALPEGYCHTTAETAFLLQLVNDVHGDDYFLDDDGRSLYLFRGRTEGEHHAARITLLQHATQILLDSPNAGLGYVLATYLERQGHPIPGEKRSWMRAYLTHAQTYPPDDELTGSTHNGDSFYNDRVKLSQALRSYSSANHSLEKTLCELIKTNLDQSFSPAFRQTLSQQNPRNSAVLEALITMSTLQGDAFAQSKSAFALEWGLSEDANKSLQVSFPALMYLSLDLLERYTTEHVLRDTQALTNALAQLEPQDYQQRRLLSAQAQRLIDRIQIDLDPSALEAPTIALFETSNQLLEATRPDRHNGAKSFLSDLTKALAEDDEFLPTLSKIAWEQSISLRDIATEREREIRQINETWSVDQFLAYMESLGYLRDVAHYSPLQSYEPTSKALTADCVISSLFSTFQKSARAEECIEALLSRQEGRFGALLVASSLCPKPYAQRELLYQALEEHADELLALEDDRFLRLLATYRKLLISDPAEVRPPGVGRIYTRLLQLCGQEAHTLVAQQLTELRQTSPADAPHEWRAQYQAAQDQLLPLLSCDPEAYLEYYASFTALYASAIAYNETSPQEPIRLEHTPSPARALRRHLDRVDDLPVHDRIRLYSLILDHDAISADLDTLDGDDLLKEIKGIIKDITERARIQLDAHGNIIRDAEGRIEYKRPSPNSWEELATLETELQRLGARHPLYSISILENDVSYASNTHDMPPALREKWLTRKPQTQLEATVNLAARVPYARRDENRDLQERVAVELLTYFQQYAIPPATQWIVLANTLSSGESWAVNYPPLVELYVQSYHKQLAISSATDYNITRAIELMASSDHPEYYDLSAGVLQAWLARAQQEATESSLRVDHRLARALPKLAFKHQSLECLDWLSSSLAEKERGMAGQVLLSLDINDLTEPPIPEFVTRVEGYQQQARQQRDQEFLDFIQTLESSDVPAVAESSRNLHNTFRSLLRKTVEKRSDLMLPLLVSYHEMTNRHYAQDRTLASRARPAYSYADHYDSYTEELNFLQYQIRKRPYLEQYKLYAKLAQHHPHGIHSQEIYKQVIKTMEKQWQETFGRWPSDLVEVALNEIAFYQYLHSQWSSVTEDERRFLESALFLFIVENRERSESEHFAAEENPPNYADLPDYYLIHAAFHTAPASDDWLEQFTKLVRRYDHAPEFQSRLLWTLIRQKRVSQRQQLVPLYLDILEHHYTQEQPRPLELRTMNQDAIGCFYNTYSTSAPHRQQFADLWTTAALQDLPALQALLHSSTLVQQAFQLALVSNQLELQEWLLTNKREELHNHEPTILALLTRGAYAQAQPLLDGGGFETDRYTGSYPKGPEADAALDQAWSHWENTPLIRLKALYCFLGQYRTQEQYTRLLAAFWDHIDQLPLADQYRILERVYRNPAFLPSSAEAERLRPYIQELSPDEAKEVGFHHYSNFTRTKLIFEAVLARAALMDGDPSPMLALYQQCQNGDELTQELHNVRFLDYARFATRHLLGEEHRTTLAAYHRMITQEVKLRYAPDQKDRFAQYITSQRLLTAQSLYGRIDLATALPDSQPADYPLILREYLESPKFLHYRNARQTWSSAHYESARHRHALVRIQMENSLQDLGVWPAEQHSRRSLLYRTLTHSGVNWLTLASAPEASEHLRHTLLLLGLKHNSQDLPPAEGERIYLQLTAYYAATSTPPEAQDDCLAAFLKLCLANDGSALLEKYARGTKFERRFLPTPRPPGDGSLDLAGMAHPALIETFQTLTLSPDTGLPQVTALEDLLVNCPDISDKLNYIALSPPRALSQTVIDRVQKGQGRTVKERIFYTVYLQPGTQIDQEFQKRLRQAFHAYHTSLAYHTGPDPNPTFYSLSFISDLN